jgi:UDP-glucose 4-epimerase
MIRDYIYVSDAIDWAASFVGRTTTHSVYNIGSGVGVSVNEVLDTISDAIGSPVAQTTVAVPEGFVHTSVTNIDRLVGEFGQRDVITLAEGIQKTWDTWRHRISGS